MGTHRILGQKTLTSRAEQKLASRDSLADWLFARVLQVLKRKGTEIYLVRSLSQTTAGKKKHLLGAVDQSRARNHLTRTENQILINARQAHNRTIEGKAIVLLHEAIHVIFPEQRENTVASMETLLWGRLNKKQKQAIKSFIPRYISNPP